MKNDIYSATVITVSPKEYNFQSEVSYCFIY